MHDERGNGEWAMYNGRETVVEGSCGRLRQGNRRCGRQRSVVRVRLKRGCANGGQWSANGGNGRGEYGSACCFRSKWGIVDDMWRTTVAVDRGEQERRPHRAGWQAGKHSRGDRGRSRAAASWEAAGGKSVVTVNRREDDRRLSHHRRTTIAAAVARHRVLLTRVRAGRASTRRRRCSDNSPM